MTRAAGGWSCARAPAPRADPGGDARAGTTRSCGRRSRVSATRGSNPGCSAVFASHPLVVAAARVVGAYAPGSDRRPRRHGGRRAGARARLLAALQVPGRLVRLRRVPRSARSARSAARDRAWAPGRRGIGAARGAARNNGQRRRRVSAAAAWTATMIAPASRRVWRRGRRGGGPARGRGCGNGSPRPTGAPRATRAGATGEFPNALAAELRRRGAVRFWSFRVRSGGAKALRDAKASTESS